MAGLPGGHDPDAVVRGADRDAAGDPVQDAALGVGGLDDVDRLGPGVQGTVHVGDPAGPQQRQQGAEAEVAGDARRVPQADGQWSAVVQPLRAARDHRAPVGLQDLHLDGVLPGHVDRFGVPGGPVPAPVRAEGLDAGPGAAQALAVEVLVVGHGVGDGPGDRAGVAEVGDAGDAGHGEADHVELVAGQADLLVDAGVLDEAVRVAREERVPGDGALPGDQPAVAAGGAGAVGGEQADRLRAEVPYRLLAPELRGEAGEQDVGGQPHGERGPGLPAAGGEADPGELGGGTREVTLTDVGEAFVDAVDVRLHPLGRLGVLLGERGLAAAGGVFQPDAAREHVPGEGARAEERRRGALRAVPFDLQLPGPVAGGDQALCPGEGDGVGSTQVRDAPGVPVDLGRHRAPSLCRAAALG